MAFDLKSAIATVAPVLASMLGGPLAGSAVTALESAFGLSSGSGVDGITQVVQSGNMTPEIIAAVRAADQKHAEIMSQQGIDVQKMNADFNTAMIEANVKDRQGARDMQVSTRSVIVPIVSCLFVVGFCIITILKINGAISAVDQTTNDLITTLRDGLMLILAFYYGTSSGSQNKDVMLYNSTPTDNQK